MGPGCDGVRVREAVEDDVPAIQGLFHTAYGEDYPYESFLDAQWLKRAVFTDDILTLIAEEDSVGVVATASVVFDIGAHSDLIGEFGRLVVHPEARGRGIGGHLMAKRVEHIRNRLHVGLVENRCVHDYSQRISRDHDFAAVGFIPMKNRFAFRESTALYARHFGDALALRCNNPRLIPEAHPLASIVLDHCGLPQDAILDEESAPYPGDGDFELEDLTAEGLPTLIRIERGRLRHREVFGPMRLHYGFFLLQVWQARYLIARRPSESDTGPVAGAVGYIHDEADRAVRIFELIAQTDRAAPFLLARLLERCRDQGVEYVEIDVSAYAPRMQRTLLELGFLPAAYVPAMVFHEVERLDVIKMVRLLVPCELGELSLTPEMQVVADQVTKAFRRQDVLPALAEAVNRLDLFGGLNDEQATRLARVCSISQLEPGSRLFAAGEPADSMFIVIDGRVGITLGEPSRKLGCVESGGSVGEVSMLTGEAHSATAVAERRLRVAVLTRHELAALTRQRPDIAVVLYRNMADGLGRKLRRLDTTLAEGV